MMKVLLFTAHLLFWNHALASEAIEWQALQLSSLDEKKVSFLDFLRDAKLVAFVSIGLDCPMVQKSFPKYEKSQAKWKKQKIKFYYIESSLDPNLKEIKKLKAQYRSTIPIFLDTKQNLAKALGFVSTNQVILFDPGKKQVLYDGALDSSINFWKQSETFESFLDQAIEELLAGKKISRPKTEAFGCAMTYKEDSK